MSIELKIKSKHLSEEARIIRFEERKLLKAADRARKAHKATGANEPYKDTKYSKFKSIQQHRCTDVRNENRATFLARAYLAGVPYTSVEQKRKACKQLTFINVVIPRVCDMVNKYGPANSRIRKRWNKDKNRMEYDKAEWEALHNKIKKWTK
jgi:hypothetical protein